MQDAQVFLKHIPQDIYRNVFFTYCGAGFAFIVNSYLCRLDVPVAIIIPEKIYKSAAGKRNIVFFYVSLQGFYGF